MFENAVQQPTFVAMYADLCRELDAVLPEFHAPGEDKPTSFKKMLANTCQEEYEATEEARKVGQGRRAGQGRRRFWRECAPGDLAAAGGSVGRQRGGAALFVMLVLGPACCAGVVLALL